MLLKNSVLFKVLFNIKLLRQKISKLTSWFTNIEFIKCEIQVKMVGKNQP